MKNTKTKITSYLELLGYKVKKFQEVISTNINSYQVCFIDSNDGNSYYEVINANDLKLF